MNLHRAAVRAGHHKFYQVDGSDCHTYSPEERQVSGQRFEHTSPGQRVSSHRVEEEVACPLTGYFRTMSVGSAGLAWWTHKFLYAVELALHW